MRKIIKMRVVLLTLLMLNIASKVLAQDENFYIFLSFGQSNMEGHAKFEPQDTVADARFKVLQAVDCDNLDRKKGQWYPAVSPITRCRTGISPADYFGRTLTEHLPENITIGIINISVGGTKMSLFNRDDYEAYVVSSPDWLQNTVKEYDGDPYGRLIEMGKLAQKDGVIKGILLHQGESDTGDQSWPMQAKVVYDNILRDLGLEANSLPLLAGEMVSAEQGGKCASMNAIIQSLPTVIPNSYVISSTDCEALDDGLHFSAAGYRELGKRYGLKMLALLGDDNKNHGHH